MIIRGGHNVVPGEVEAALYEHPAVAEAAVAGVAHPVLGEDVAAWVVLRGPASDRRSQVLPAGPTGRLQGAPAHYRGRCAPAERERQGTQGGPRAKRPDGKRDVTTSYTTLTVEEIGHVRRITLEQAGPTQPADASLRPRGPRGGEDAEHDAGVSVVVIRSTGRSFSSGYGFIAEDTDPGDFPRTRHSRATCQRC